MKDSLGQFEIITMLAVIRCGNNAYAAQVQQEIRRATHRGVKLGTIHTTLQRLETKGLAKSDLIGNVAGGIKRSRRYVSITEDGMTAIRNFKMAFGRLARGLKLIRKKPGRQPDEDQCNRNGALQVL
jgi:PadR family transcriptional regulator, regulatory protein PadR